MDEISLAEALLLKALVQAANTDSFKFLQGIVDREAEDIVWKDFKKAGRDTEGHDYNRGYVDGVMRFKKLIEAARTRLDNLAEEGDTRGDETEI